MKRNPVFAQDAAVLSREWGIHFAADVGDWIDSQAAMQMAMDAQPVFTTAVNGGIPNIFTTFVSPQVVRVLQTPNMGAKIYGEKKEGDWTKDEAIFPVIENEGFVNSYGDFSTSGRSDVNANFVNRQSYFFQTHIEYGDREVDRAGAANLNWISEKQISAAKTLDKFLDYTYHFGVAGLQCYGVLNDPALSAALTPSTKQAGNGNRWIFNGAINAQPTEVFNDLLNLFTQLQLQAPSYITDDTPMALVLPNTVISALYTVNIYGLTAEEQLKKRFPKLEIIQDFRYATAAGNVVQLIAKELDGNQTGYCAFAEKLRDHRLVLAESSMRQKKTSGTWGAVLRYPMGIAQMLGV